MTGRHHLGRRSVATAAALAVALDLVLLTGAWAIGGTATLSAEPRRAAFRERVLLAGVLETTAPCLESRTVRIEESASETGPWTEAASITSGSDGTFEATVRPQSHRAYRATIPAAARGAETCEAVISSVATVRVEAGVTIGFSSDPAKASRCTRIEISVAPPKPGDEVVLQRLRGSSWKTVVRPTLGTESSVRIPFCPRWGELGDARFRARWPSQDEENLAAMSAERLLRIVKADWMRSIDRLAERVGMGVSVREAGAFLYRRSDTVGRIPASNEKLLMSMALLDRLGPDARLPTRALGRLDARGVVRGSLWLVGRGDPQVGPSKLARIAQRLKDAGVRRITGGVRGSTRGFDRDWWAPGWRSYFPRTQVPLPTALVFKGNTAGGKHIRDPERRAAKALTAKLRNKGIRVGKPPRAGRHPRDLPELARTRSRPLSALLAITNHGSVNFFAEVLGKRLGVAARGAPGSIAKGAAATASWADGQGVAVTAYDGSGLSYANRATPAGIARLLGKAEKEPWGRALRSTLPPGGGGTLRHRLGSVPVRAKTGTLAEVSALSGWVLAKRPGTWIEFSLVTNGAPTNLTKELEDRIVRILWRQAG